MKPSFYLTVLIFVLLSACRKEPCDPQAEGATVKIVFNTSPYTRTAAARTDNEDGVQTIDLWTFAHDKNDKIINFFHKSTDTSNVILMQSNFFEINARGETVSYTTLYAAANISRINLNGAQIGGKYNDLAAYTKGMEHQQSKYMTGRPEERIPIKAEEENLLRDLVTDNRNAGSINMDYPVMTDVQRADGGIAALTMPLVHTYCRIRFTFIITGGVSSDRLTIHSVSLSNLKSGSYLFREDNHSSASVTSLWNESGGRVFKSGDTYCAQPLSPMNTGLTLCRAASDPHPFYIYSYQSISEDGDNDPVITLRITGNGAARTLTARLYDAHSSDGKKHHGLQRNHSYEVISTLNVSTLQLDELSINAHDWYDRGETDIPPFE